MRGGAVRTAAAARATGAAPDVNGGRSCAGTPGRAGAGPGRNPRPGRSALDPGPRSGPPSGRYRLPPARASRTVTIWNGRSSIRRVLPCRCPGTSGRAAGRPGRSWWCPVAVLPDRTGDVMTVGGVVDQGDAPARLLQVHEPVGAGLEVGGLPAGVGVGGPVGMAELGLGRTALGVQVQREGGLEEARESTATPAPRWPRGSTARWAGSAASRAPDQDGPAGHPLTRAVMPGSGTGDRLGGQADHAAT